MVGKFIKGQLQQLKKNYIHYMNGAPSVNGLLTRQFCGHADSVRLKSSLYQILFIMLNPRYKLMLNLRRRADGEN